MRNKPLYTAIGMLFTMNLCMILQASAQSKGLRKYATVKAVRTVSYGDNTDNTNTALGYKTLWTNSTGHDNTAAGYISLAYNTIGSDNTAMGSGALFSNISGNNNTALGSAAMYDNTIGSDNTAIGWYALLSNINGSENTAIGTQALASNGLGYGNTASGAQALVFNTSGYSNTASGAQALVYNTTGAANAAIGMYALLSNSDGSANTAIGFNAGGNNDGNRGNTFLGFNTNVNAPLLSNCVAIGGNGNLPIGASNTIRAGNSATSSIGGQVDWTVIADFRIQKDAQENVPGLAFIRELRPVTYHYDKGKEDELFGVSDTLYYSEKYAIEKIRFSGFIGQDVETAAKKLNYEFSGIDKMLLGNDSIYGLRYAGFAAPMVKAIQEIDEKQVILNEIVSGWNKQLFDAVSGLQTENERLKMKTEKLEMAIEQLKARYLNQQKEGM